MGEVLWIDLRNWIAGQLYTALGPDSTSDLQTINAVHLTDVDGPTEWQQKRQTYAPPFAQLRDGPVDQQTSQIVRGYLQQRRQYRTTILVVAAGPAPDVEDAARILAERAYTAARTWPTQLHTLPASTSGERADGLSIGQIRIATFPPIDQTYYSVGYIPIRIETETGLP